MNSSGQKGPGQLRTQWAGNAIAAADVTLPITASQVRSAGAAWGQGKNGPARRALWLDIETLAGDLWAASGVDERNACWVRLAFAVGNFKRQGGTVLHPSNLPLLPAVSNGESDRKPRKSISISIGENEVVTLERRSLDALRQFGHKRGFGLVATASTLASVLWPDHHVILDSRDYQVAVGFLAAQGESIVLPNENRPPREPEWSEYDWFRTVIFNTAESLRDRKTPRITAVMVQRATWMAFRYASTVKGRTWDHYGKTLLSKWP